MIVVHSLLYVWLCASSLTWITSTHSLIHRTITKLEVVLVPYVLKQYPDKVPNSVNSH